MKEITRSKRMTNYMIDVIFISLITAIIRIFLPPSFSVAIFYIVYIIYYTLFESYDGRTFGKMVTNTAVVDMNNSKPSIGKIILRTLLRLNPLDQISYLCGQVQGTHDVLSNTRLVIRAKKS